MGRRLYFWARWPLALAGSIEAQRRRRARSRLDCARSPSWFVSGQPGPALASWPSAKIRRTPRSRSIRRCRGAGPTGTTAGLAGRAGGRWRDRGLRKRSAGGGSQAVPEHCAGCHRLDRMGPADEDQKGPNLSRFASRAWLAGFLQAPDSPTYHGRSKVRGGMKPVELPANQPGDQLGDLVEYLYSLAGPASAGSQPIDAGKAARGAVLFEEKNCDPAMSGMEDRRPRTEPRCLCQRDLAARVPASSRCRDLLRRKERHAGLWQEAGRDRASPAGDLPARPARVLARTAAKVPHGEQYQDASLTSEATDGRLANGCDSADDPRKACAPKGWHAWCFGSDTLSHCCPVLGAIGRPRHRTPTLGEPTMNKMLLGLTAVFALSVAVPAYANEERVVTRRKRRPRQEGWQEGQEGREEG